MANKAWVYLYHLEAPLGHARDEAERAVYGLPARTREYTPHCQHYTGVTNNLTRRDGLHQSGQGARVLAAAKRQGIGFRRERVWGFPTMQEAREWESYLKNTRKDARPLCPVCGGERAMRRGQPERRRA